MSMRKLHSRSPNELDLTNVFGQPTAAARAAPPASLELALESLPVRKVATFAVRWEDKVILDSMQAWWSYKNRQRMTQWELVSFVVSDALANRDGRFWGFDAAM